MNKNLLKTLFVLQLLMSIIIVCMENPKEEESKKVNKNKSIDLKHELSTEEKWRYDTSKVPKFKPGKAMKEKSDDFK